MAPKDALKLPWPLESLWTVLFVLVNTIPPVTVTMLSALILLPLLGWYDMKLVVRLNCIIADWLWWMMGTGIEKYGRSKYHFYGDKIPMRENAFLISNHLTILDWAFLFSVAGRRGRLGALKFFAKKSIAWVPGFGWGLFLLDSLLISRNWLADQSLINNTFAKLRSRRLPFWVVSFLEGTRLTPSKLKASQEYAKKKDLPHLNNVLLPRTKGFIATITSLRDEFDAVYDLTYAYEGNKTPTITDLAMRRIPDLHFYVRRYPISEMPTDEKGLADWCMRIWTEKDALIDEFKATGSFPRPAEEGEWSLPYKHEPMNLWAPPRGGQ